MRMRIHVQLFTLTRALIISRSRHFVKGIILVRCDLMFSGSPQHGAYHFFRFYRFDSATLASITEDAPLE